MTPLMDELHDDMLEAIHEEVTERDDGTIWCSSCEVWTHEGAEPWDQHGTGCLIALLQRAVAIFAKVRSSGG